jgi:hypothetical protein
MVSFTPWSALFPRIKTTEHIGREANWVPDPIWMLGTREKFLRIPLMQPRFLDRPASKLVTVLSYSGSRDRKKKDLRRPLIFLGKILRSGNASDLCSGSNQFKPRPWNRLPWLVYNIVSLAGTSRNIILNRPRRHTAEIPNTCYPCLYILFYSV